MKAGILVVIRPRESLGLNKTQGSGWCLEAKKGTVLTKRVLMEREGKKMLRLLF